MLIPFIPNLLKSILMFKTIKEKVLGTITAQPKIITLGIGLAVTFVIGSAIGVIETQQANAFIPVCQHWSSQC
jgi:hypothetical protein